MGRCLLNSSSLPQSLWGEAINTATYIKNRAPTKVLGDITPYEKWCGKKPSVSHFKTFGCDAVVLKKGPKSKGGKFLPKGIKMKFVGYQQYSKAYRLYNTDTKQIHIARDVLFFEESFESNKVSTDMNDEHNSKIFELFRNENQDGPKDNTASIMQQENEEEIKKKDENMNVETSEESSDTEDTPAAGNKRKRGRPRVLRTGGKGRPRKIYCTRNEAQMLNSIIENPGTVSQALNGQDSSKWKEAMNIEYESLLKNKTWDLVDKPSGKNIIGCKWVFTIKRKPDGTIEKYKARLVAQGCSQKYNIDFQDTFAPVVRHSTIRLILALAAKHKLLVNHVDIVAAYLNGNLEEEVYMAQPEMFESEKYPNKVCKLKKALYGLKQAGREWNKRVNDILIEMNFQRCKYDTCVYFKRNEHNLCIIALYVDDMLVACSSESEMKKTIFDLNNSVEAIDRGPVSFYLGMEIDRDGLRGGISIHQKKYTEEILKKWNMAECKPAATPWANGTVITKCTENCENLDSKTYQSLIGGLMYLAVITRPDLIHVVSKLSQFNSHPHKEHFQAAKYVLRYLKKNPIGKISYSSNVENFLCFTDSDWGSDSYDRKSYSGHVVLMADGPVAWESRKQPVVALSTMEAEYIALCQGSKEIVSIRGLLKELGFTQYINSPTPILCDNQSASFMVKNPTVQKKSKHIDIRYHYVRDKYEEKEIDLQYITSEENAADILTKALTKQKHINGCKLLKIEF